MVVLMVSVNLATAVGKVRKQSSLCSPRLNYFKNILNKGGMRVQG